MAGTGIDSDLNNVSYVTLALIGDGGASPHDLVDMNRRGGQIFYAVAPSRLYAEPKRLETLGYVTSEKRPGKTRERTFYTLTTSGRDALRDWILAPPSSRCGARSRSRSSGSPRATGAWSRCPIAGRTCSSSSTSASGCSPPSA